MRSKLLVLAAAVALPGADVEFFEKKIRPILVNNCYACHSADTKPAGGLRVDDKNGILRGGDSGPAIVPGDPAKSHLLARIQDPNPRRRMPRESAPLSTEQIADLTVWVKDGAPWPEEKVVLSAAPSAMYQRLKEKHWSLQPVKAVAPPAVKNAAWASTEIDRFVLAKLEAKGLSPAADASRPALVRRLSYDLTGLPPAPEEIDAFAADKNPDAYERLVDRLLASPRFGERWGRHWLDVARYGESSGPSRNIPYPHAWRYRDYVIDSVNADVPFNRFVQEQIAGDLLPAATIAERDRLQIATGFLALGPKDVNQRFKERFLMDNVAEQIDTVTRSVLGLTVGCARCHDHKFDPIPTADYYALAGIFSSTVDAAGVRSKMGGAGLDYYDPKLLVRLASYSPQAPSARLEELQAKVAEAKKAWDGIRGTPEGLKIAANGRPTQQPFRLKYEALQAELLELTDPASYGFAVHGAREAEAPADTAIRIRGEAEKMGPVVPRGFLSALSVPGVAEVNRTQSGRLELAQWLTNDQNPLTARVMANRVWKHLFGQGIVSTTDNFGMTGDRPSDNELLDYLSSRFVAGGWSVKQLIRTIVLTHAYRLGSESSTANQEADPSNRLIWRHSPRRLDAEEIRDTILATSGRLKLERPARLPGQKLKMIEMRDNGVESRTIHEISDASVVRSVYLPLLRGVTPRALEAFDPVTQTLVSGERDATTVPGQALFLLNSAFVRREALEFAQRLLRGGNDDARVREAYRLTLGRAPSVDELKRARAFLSGYEATFAVTSRPLPPPPPPPVVAKTPDPNVPFDPDNVDRTDFVTADPTVEPVNGKQAAWMSFVQSLYATAEFRFVR